MGSKLYSQYISDIEIAVGEIKKMKLYPRNVIADFYCIPSHNHQAYYVLLCETETGYELIYNKPQIQTIEFEMPIKMYRFTDCKKAEKSNRQQGNFLIGIKKIERQFGDELIERIKRLPEKYIYSEKEIVLDGVVQGVRFREDKTKTVLYREASKIPEIIDADIMFWHDFYLEMEKIIENQ